MSRYGYFINRFNGPRINSARPCSSTLGQVERFSWTDPLSLVHLFHVDLKTPLFLFHLFHVDLETCFYLFHLSCANLCHLVVLLEPVPTLFSHIFFWVSQCHSIFGKTLFTENLVRPVLQRFRVLEACSASEHASSSSFSDTTADGAGSSSLLIESNEDAPRVGVVDAHASAS